ncbi:MAG: hypothetical protein ABI565_03155 [Vicinamibacteria bacterium]
MTLERNGRRLVIALASALGAALLIIAFLLGRVSSRPAVITVAAPTPASASPQASHPAPNEEEAPPPALPAATEATPLADAPPSVFPSSESPVAPPFASAPASSPSPDRLKIAAYFSQVERLEDLGAGDPQTFANSMVQSMSSGDFAGFDDLLSKARTQRQRLRTITPPPACIEHHRLALALAGDSVTMLERVKTAMVKGDTTALLAIATEGHTLETQANQLKAMGAAIKRQAGL